ncbi:conserved hypothetical protein [Segniliparus rotundus DSM 44985]|uniref:Multimeric flavodoxin WrbA n=1 Tax=Segniliparus rotundus (strain ATCC BAA-972 / CDC 1076 / CIP 108378 / DSM 44985 / JCM 13578) TaxID=640132 RepID=D6Z920_SEGRD|nr:flavodoxin family protein [Segniliparus rotundus]ADG98450.1 conserved hypothetical protein [Segniliparus rotundus DSM 44985]
MPDGPKTLLVVHHTPSPATREIFEKVLAGAKDPEIEGVQVRAVPALSATAFDMLSADGYLFGTTANFGYMSGALKHFFDTVYYPCLDAVAGRGFGLWAHGSDDTGGAVRAVLKLAGGMGLAQTAAPLELTGAPDSTAREACYELGAAVAASLMR